ncbi:Vps51/Vps67-domain-containing protein [Cokeromyces recurvatus]|uniref:Vps51/Vps67-domain-containing protein n=1 Tax=Cokeromyces recurvatus TaxID=90255 RepID=UPI00221F856C|nr:Vps51/Vps67-domain-containing protein [Cokeromyces recurvatus]KAI7897693.1 Vps51/Vps67-domain-containing protein [Cokeromyces recurvatus]
MENAPTLMKRQPKPRERNSLLKKYYGIKDASNSTPAQQEESSRPFDLDAPSFNLNKYFAKLLKEKTLQGLMEKDNCLVGEIREIDGDMKTLVYENYNKFISATDTIRKMKSNVDSMESEMTRLNENIKNISEKSKIINQELGPNLQKIQQLSKVHNSLKRLQFIFELPNRLQHCLNKGKYGNAVKYYSKASRILNHYQHMAAFKGIEMDCHDIMEKVKTNIWESLANPDNVTFQNIAENIKLLVLLGKDNVQELWKQYIQIQLKVFQRIERESPEPCCVQDLIPTYIKPLEYIVHHFEDIFLIGQLEESIDYDNNSKKCLLNAKEKEEAKNDLLTEINPYIDKFFELTSEFIELPLNISLKTPLKQVEHLNELKSALFEYASSLISIAKIDERMTLHIAEWENDLINNLLSSSLPGLKESINKFINSLQETNQNEFDISGIAAFIQDTHAWLINYLIESCLLPLKDCLDISNKKSLARIQAGIKAVWQKLANKFENVDKTSNLNSSSLQILVLVCSRLCYDLADNGIFQLYSVFSAKFCKQQDKQTYSFSDVETNIDPCIISDMNEMIDYYLNTGQTLLNKQVMQEGYELSNRIQEAYFIPIPLSIPPIRQVSTIWFFIHQRINYIERLMEAIYPQSRRSIDSTVSNSEYPYGTQKFLPSSHSLASLSSDTHSNKPSRNDMHIMNNIDKLFAERIDVYRKVEPTPIGVYTGLILIILKTFLEVTREMQIDTAHYQQIQVDVAYIKRMIWSHVGDEKWITTMLHEILSSVTRCASPISMSQEELTSILSSQ